MSQDRELNLSEFLPYRFSVLSNTISESIARRYRNEFGLSVPQWRVMAVLAQAPGLTAKAVGERTAMDKVAVSRAVSALVDAGHVERRTTEHDARSSALTLTEGGEAIYEKVAPLALAFERDLIAALGPDDKKVLDGLMEALARALSPDRPLW